MISLRKRAGVFREQLREIRVLKIAQPIRNSEMTKIHDRKNAAAAEVRKNEICKRPIILAWSQEHSVQGQSIPQKAHSQFIDLIEIGSPVPIMTAEFHFIEPEPPILDGRRAVLNASGKHECRYHVELSHRQ